MNETKKMQQLMKDVATEMEKLGYSKSSMQHYHEVWNRYLKYTVRADINRHDMEQFHVIDWDRAAFRLLR